MVPNGEQVMPLGLDFEFCIALVLNATTGNVKRQN
jgi:hypothetical protein